MACFVAPLVEAIAITAYRKLAGKSAPASVKTLETLLWGGTIMLIVDHIINGELTWRFPFFTALANGGGWPVMLREIVTVGIPMCLVITVLWAIWALVASHRSKARAWK